MLISGMRMYTLSQISVSITLIIMMVTVMYHSSVVVKKARNCNLTPLPTILQRLAFKSIRNDTLDAELITVHMDDTDSKAA